MCAVHTFTYILIVVTEKTLSGECSLFQMINSVHPKTDSTTVAAREGVRSIVFNFRAQLNVLLGIFLSTLICLMSFLRYTKIRLCVESSALPGKLCEENVLRYGNAEYSICEMFMEGCCGLGFASGISSGARIRRQKASCINS